MSFIKLTDGEQLFFRDQGQGPAIILIHGWPLNADMWEYQVPTLIENGFRVISYDRRGFGRSSQPITGYNYDTFASDLKELINQLEIQSCALVGFSMGGGEIARYLRAYGTNKISHAILVSSVTPFLFKTSNNPTGVDGEAFEDMIEGLQKDRPHFLKGFAKDFYGAGLFNTTVSEDIIQWSLNLAMMASPIATIECVRAFSKTDFRHDMHAFKLPTLIIHGTSDKTVPIAPTADVAAKMIPNAKLIRYDGAPHGVFFTHQKQLCEDLMSFIRGDQVFDDLAPERVTFYEEPLPQF